MSNVVDYEILVGDSFGSLRLQVKDFIAIKYAQNEFWEPVGAFVVIHASCLCQTMVRVKG